jgi:hypothetical protein
MTLAGGGIHRLCGSRTSRVQLKAIDRFNAQPSKPRAMHARAVPSSTSRGDPSEVCAVDDVKPLFGDDVPNASLVEQSAGGQGWT